MPITDAELKDFDRLDRIVTDYRAKQQAAILSRLTVAELRILLIHYRLAYDASDAREWRKSEMVAELAFHMANTGEC